MNTFKAVVAGVGFVLYATLVTGWNPVETSSLSVFLMSGALGLGLADLCLFFAFADIGPSRTLMLFGFAPLMNGVLSYYLFDQTLDGQKLWAIVFMILCLLTFSYERRRLDRSWGLRGLLVALLGVFLDSLGVCSSRWAFEHSPMVTPMEANVYRTVGALMILSLLCWQKRQALLKPYWNLPNSERLLAVGSGVVGTFLSLWLFLSAIQVGHLATLSSIAVTAPFLAAVFESLFHKKWPGPFFWLASVFFVLGFLILFGDLLPL